MSFLINKPDSKIAVLVNAPLGDALAGKVKDVLAAISRDGFDADLHQAFVTVNKVAAASAEGTPSPIQEEPDGLVCVIHVRYMESFAHLASDSGETGYLESARDEAEAIEGLRPHAVLEAAVVFDDDPASAYLYSKPKDR